MKEKEDDSGEKGKAVGSEDGEEYDEVVGGVSDDEFDVDAEVTAAPKKKAKTVTSTKSNNRYPSWTPQVHPINSVCYTQSTAHAISFLVTGGRSAARIVWSIPRNKGGLGVDQ